MLSRLTESIYYSWSSAQNNLRSSDYINNYDSRLCRFCGVHVESVTHVLVDCFGLDHDSLRTACACLDVDYNISNCLSNPHLK